MTFEDYLKSIQSSGKVYFTLQQALEANLKISKEGILMTIYRRKKLGEIISPLKGLYVIVPPQYQNQGCIPAPELIPIMMRYLKIDYYVGLLTACAYHGASHQKSASFQVIVSKRMKPRMKFGTVEIGFIYKKSLENLPVQDVVVNTGYLKISSPELTLLDLFSYSAKSGGLNHIATILSELAETINPVELLKVAKLASKTAYLQRLGYILEKIDADDEKAKQNIINKLTGYFSKIKLNFIPLAPEIPDVGFPRCPKWMITQNTTIESDL
jgi:predicted transcriptional regulator of viral defense system